MTAASIPAQSRRRTAAALAAVAVGAAALLIGLQPGASAAAGAPSVVGRPVAGAVAPVTTTAGKLTLSVDPAGGLTPAGATLKVRGSGFDPAKGIYVAICHADGKAPASLRDCVGGAIPDANPTKSWAHISNTAQPGGAGEVTAWGTGGSFAVQLIMPASNSASDALDCAKVACAVYTAPDTGTDTAENLSVPLAYAAPVTTSSSTPTSASATTTSSVAPSTTPSSTAASSAPVSSSPQFSTSPVVVPTTVQAKSVRSPTIVAGGEQEVLFAGFAKNEPVTVTLYSAPQALPAARADGDGVVKIDFIVPADLVPATHLLRVVGQTSKVTGIASFVVTAPVVSSSAVAVPSTPATSAASSSAPVSSAAPVPATLPVASSVATTETVSSAAAAVLPPASTGKAVWPWYALGALLVILAAVIAYLLVRRSRLAAERRENDALLADAAAAEHERNLDAIARANADAPTAYLGGTGPGVPPTPPTPPTGGYAGFHPGEHGLLSGRDNPDSPGLLSGTGYRGLPPVDPPPVDPPTTVLPDERTAYLPGEATTQLPGGQPDRTPADDTSAGGPATGTWRPNFDDDDEGGDQPEDPGTGGRHTRPS